MTADLSLVTLCSIVSTIVIESASARCNIRYLIILLQVLFQGLDEPVKGIITLVMGFLVICVGITILQLSKVDPNEFKFKGLDRKSTILLQATRARAEGVGEDSEKGLMAIETPGAESIRGSFGAVGSIIRARTLRKMSMNSGRERSADAELRARPSRRDQPNTDSVDATPYLSVDTSASHLRGLTRHQLYDPPVSSSPSTLDPPDPLGQIQSSPSKRQQTIKFGDRDMVHSYARVGVDDNRSAVHEYRESNVPLPNVSPTFKSDPFGKLPITPGSPLSISHQEDSDRVDSPAKSPVKSPVKEPKRTGPAGPRHFRTSSAKSYPKGNDGDDEEESESLWRKNEKQSDEESEMALEESLKGIRLVTTQPKS